MRQTTIFNYFCCNNEAKKQQKLIKHPTILKQAILTDYFRIIPKEKSILDYFKINLTTHEGLPSKKDLTSYEEQEKIFQENSFDIILVDIEKSVNGPIICVKKNMYDVDLQYIGITYRWGEVEEELVQAPDYIAHITSFRLSDLQELCYYISREPDLKCIPYLWIDAISVDQHNFLRKKETILRMHQIYKRSTYILAVPDLNIEYLWENPANFHYMRLILTHKQKIYQDILYGCDNQKKDNTQKDENSMEMEMAYEFLKYLVREWANRAWAISEFIIARKKEKKCGRPLKYMFLSLFDISARDNNNTYFFTHSFFGRYTKLIHYDNSHQYSMELVYMKDFFSHLVESLTQRDHLDMILNCKAARNQDRFNAILPSWDKYCHIIANKNTIFHWNITDMTSVRLKLYEIMDLWDKARLLYACSFGNQIILPSFATNYHLDYLDIIEKKEPESSHKEYSETLLRHVLDKNGNNKKDDKYILISEMTSGLYCGNLKNIQLYQHQHHFSFLSVSSYTYFIYNGILSTSDESLLPQDLFENKNNLIQIFIPFFRISIPNYISIMPPYVTGIYILGCVNKNKWVLKGHEGNNQYKHSLYTPTSDNYTFNIY